LRDFDMDTYSGPGAALPGRVYDLAGYKLYHWPGHGVADNAFGLQFVEGEYMKSNEYDDLIRDPSDFWMRVYMPRIMNALEPFRKLRPYTSMIEICAPGGGYILSAGSSVYKAPPDNMRAVMEAAKEYGVYR